MTSPKFVKAIYHAKAQVAEFIADDGKHYVRSGGTLPWRINNCGDLMSPMVDGTPTPKKTKNYIGFANPGNSSRHFFIFPDYETGRTELKASLQRKHGTKTLRQTIEVFAPKSDGNDTDEYLAKLCKLSGVSDDTRINELNEKQLDSLVDGIATLEGYNNKKDTRQELVVNVSHIHATDGARPLANEELVLTMDGKQTTVKSNAIGQFPAIVHGGTAIQVQHKTIDGQLKKVGELPAGQGQNLGLWTKVSEFFGKTAPDKPTETPTSKRQPFSYTIQPADSLSKIAAKFKTDVDALKRDNQLRSNNIFPGHVLGIYGPPPSQSGTAPPKKAALVAALTTSKTGASAAGSVGAKPKPNPAPAQKTTPARSNEGQGAPLALITPEEGVAPWMKIAVREALAYAGQDESVITRTHNYHRLITDRDRAGGEVLVLKGKDGKPLKNKDGSVRTKTKFDGLPSLDGPNYPWCAAFVNYCLKEAGYAAARRIASSYSYSEDKDLFVSIKKPIYGALRFSHRDGGGHVCFVYGQVGGKLIVLGGNQTDQLCFQLRNMSEKGSVFYVPIPYFEFAKKAQQEDIPTIDIEALRKSYKSAVMITDKEIKALDIALKPEL